MGRTQDLAGVEPLPLTGALAAKLEAYIVELMERYSVPGAAVAVVQRGKVVFARGYGVRERGGTDPVREGKCG